MNFFKMFPDQCCPKDVWKFLWVSLFAEFVYSKVDGFDYRIKADSLEDFYRQYLNSTVQE